MVNGIRSREGKLYKKSYYLVLNFVVIRSKRENNGLHNFHSLVCKAKTNKWGEKIKSASEINFLPDDELWEKCSLSILT